MELIAAIAGVWTAMSLVTVWFLFLSTHRKGNKCLCGEYDLEQEFSVGIQFEQDGGMFRPYMVHEVYRCFPVREHINA